MKIVVTGSLGNIGRPLSEILTKQGHQVVVISSNPEKAAEVKKLGAHAAIGSLTDPDFLVQRFQDADAVYAMIPFSFSEADQPAYLRRIAGNYVQAIRQAGVKRVVLLSGWAAGLSASERVEDVFDELSDVSLTRLRPTYFYSNFYGAMNTIKQRGVLVGNVGGDDRLVFVSPLDIADVAADELTTAEPSRIRYIGSEEMTCSRAAQILGAAIGKPLQWILQSNQEMVEDYKSMGMPDTLAETLVDMQATMHDGSALARFHEANPALGRVKMADFAKEFAVVYHSS